MYSLCPQKIENTESSVFLVWIEVDCFFIVYYYIDQYIYLLIEYCIKQHKGGVIWSGAKGISIGKKNTELVSDSWPTWFWKNFPMRMLRYLTLNSMNPIKDRLLLVGLVSIDISFPLWLGKVSKNNPYQILTSTEENRCNAIEIQSIVYRSKIVKKIVTN